MGDSLDDVVAGLNPRPQRAKEGTGPGDTVGHPVTVPGSSAAALGTVFSRWEELVGSAVARHTRPLRIEGGTLVVAVDQPPWATQLRALAPGILARLTERSGEQLDRLEVVVRPAR